MKINSCPVCDSNDLIAGKYLKGPTQDFWEYDCFKGKNLATCRKCMFTFTAEIFEKGALSKFYNTLYSGSDLKSYDAAQNYEYNIRSMSHVNFIKLNLDLKDGMNILEIGPNENGMVPSFSLFCNPNYFYYEQLEFPVINSYGGQRLGNYFDKKSAADLSNDQKMDLIVLSHVFEHFEPQHLNRDIEAMRLALKENGHISIEVPLQTINIDMHPPHTQFFNVKNMSLLFEKHGFEIVSTQNINLDVGFSESTSSTEPKNSSRPYIELIKKIMSIFLPRKLRLKLLRPFFEKKLKTLYDGRPYMRVLAKKIPLEN
ncbi:class I SAM-dependent methyltransferase [Gammaproteobacteria bacterium]|nr:class I SAM-dependent methyltransferase [Gammaproteobacteria bacterium]MDC0511100.1 class I SAM-dependent methyltransferase [bacterium]